MILLRSEAETLDFGRALGTRLAPGDAVLLQGELGAGKTTLSRGILAGLGYRGEVASPTFAIAIDYRPPEVRLPTQHLDLYRLRNAEEVDELGLDDGIADGALIVEWPELVLAKPWPGRLLLTLEPAEAGRCLTAQPGRDWERRWPL